MEHRPNATQVRGRPARPLAARPDREAWSEGELATLRQLVRLELPMRVIARKLARPESAVRQKAHRVAMAEMMGS